MSKPALVFKTNKAIVCCKNKPTITVGLASMINHAGNKQRLKGIPRNLASMSGSEPQSTLEDAEASERDDSVPIIRTPEAKCRSEDNCNKAKPANCESNTVAQRIPRLLDEGNPNCTNGFGNYSVGNETKNNDTRKEVEKDQAGKYNTLQNEKPGKKGLNDPERDSQYFLRASELRSVTIDAL